MTIKERILQVESQCGEAFKRIDETALVNTARVLDAFHKHEVATRHFAATTGYGYGDIGRDTLEAIYADLFGTQAALVRPQIASGTHALALCLFGLLLPGDELLSVTGAPYDTLEGIIGIHKPTPGSLAEMGVTYRQVELDAQGKLDLRAIWAAMRTDTRVVAVQRSRGYAARRSLTPEELTPLSEMLRQDYPNACLLVDNCYGEFVQAKEPTHYGADVCAGSLIKNPGGGLAPTGGYVVGRKDLIERISYRLTAPGVGAEIGSYAAGYQSFYQGLFMAPHVVGQALRTATLAAAIFAQLGIRTTPNADEPRTDIIQALELGTPERIVAFCQGIQSASPVDSMAMPEPWDMPGYQEQVIMAAGTFVSGASIELSADAPMREPYTVYLQGGLSYEHGKLALMRTLEHMVQKGCLPM
ncbi:MAG: methionine gamma-lyase family protein [Eubacteriales bacterium]|nr:methionine gamma-lyase family protein [Eubacteriales bacterium]